MIGFIKRSRPATGRLDNYGRRLRRLEEEITNYKRKLAAVRESDAASSLRLHQLEQQIASLPETRTCYCEIGAGGRPCVSRKHCDKFREIT